MRALAIVHQPDAGPGVFAEAMSAAGVELDSWSIPDRGGLPQREISDYDAVLSFGGAMHADQEDQHPWLQFEKDFLAAMLEDGMPLLGVCLGAQLLAEAAGGSAVRLGEPEIGWCEVNVTSEGAEDPLLGPLGPSFEAFEWHSYGASLPEGAVELARNRASSQAYRIGERAWGIQFHAEVTAADIEHWIDDFSADEDAVRTGLDPEALRTESREKIAGGNALGRELCARFIEAVYSGVT
ncbi:MAG: type 1 glutamine amidotransferase [Solirubrobacterales bacterium]